MNGLPSGVAERVARRLTPEPERELPTDPVKWTRERLGMYLWSGQRRIVASVLDNRKTAVQSCHGIGKALALDTPLPTPTGWTTMGDVRPGDWLLDEKGRPCRVRSASRHFEDRPRYRVTFDDRTEVVADAEHEWSVTTFRSRANRRMRVGTAVGDWRDEHDDLGQIVTTRGLAAMLRTAWGQRSAAVPATAPLELPERELPVDPYVLGIFLADGARANGAITVAAHEAEWIEPRLGGHRIPSSARAGSFAVRVPGLGPKLRRIGALDPKRIPPSYARASRAQRLEVLRGIMDGDGFAKPGGGAGIDLTHELLALDVIELMRSLGLRPTWRTGPAVLNGRRVGTRWRINVTPTGEPIFSLPAKLRFRPSAQRCRYTQRLIVSVEAVEPGPTRCVEVDSPSHLFLCGDGMIPTHNSFTAADLAVWWIESHPPGEALVVTSAPSGDQVRMILWGEIRKLHARGRMPGTITRARTPEWTVGETLVGFGRKPTDFVDANEARSQFQGIHARYLLVILDEACGIPGWLWDATLSLVTNEGSRILAIGNPDDPTTTFAEVCAPGSGYNVIAISAFDTPNFTDEQVPEDLREMLVGPAYVAEAERAWGVDSPLYISKVLGQFPEVADDVIISPKLIREAHERDLSGNALADQGRYGMDVADTGEDESVIYRNRAGMIRLEVAWKGIDTDKGQRKARAVLDEHLGNLPMQIDFPGVGGAIYHPLNNADYRVTAFNGGERAHDAERFVNRNAEAWWAFREGLEAGLIDLDPEDDVLASQLQTRRWQLDASGRRIRIETKDELAKRGVKSPDRADAAILSYYRQVGDLGDADAMIAAMRADRTQTVVGEDWLTRPT